jgi:hypothetical protein
MALATCALTCIDRVIQDVAKLMTEFPLMLRPPAEGAVDDLRSSKSLGVCRSPRGVFLSDSTVTSPSSTSPLMTTSPLTFMVSCFLSVLSCGTVSGISSPSRTSFLEDSKRVN